MVTSVWTIRNNTVKWLAKHAAVGEFDWIFHIGDIGYADDHVLQFQETWNKFFEMIEPFTSSVPYMVSVHVLCDLCSFLKIELLTQVCPGNHEYVSYDPLLWYSTKNFVVYNARFLMPHANDKSQSMYYSFDYGNVHIISYRYLSDIPMSFFSTLNTRMFARPTYPPTHLTDSTETSFQDAPYGAADDFGDQVTWIQAGPSTCQCKPRQSPMDLRARCACVCVSVWLFSTL